MPEAHPTTTIFRDRTHARFATAGGARTIWSRVLIVDGRHVYGDPVPFRPLPGAGAYIVKVTPRPERTRQRRGRYLGLDRVS